MKSFTDSEVIQIRERYAQGGISQLKLADEWRTESAIIGAIVRGDSYADAGGPITKLGKKRVMHLQNSVGNAWCGATGKGLFITRKLQEISCAGCQGRRTESEGTYD